MEIWKDVLDYEGLYEVSSNGQVRTSEGKTTIRTDGLKRIWNVRILKQKTDKRGYKRVDLWKDGKEKTMLVHRLVGESFLENPENHPIINHIDANPSNNNYMNLEWCSYSHNVGHAFDNGLVKTAIGVYVADKETNEVFYFNSMAKASKFMNFNRGWLSLRAKRGLSLESDSYKAELETRQEDSN